jgi:small-conductance mechanosensitive channel
MADRTTIMAGDYFIMSVFDLDASLQGISRQVLADIMKDKISGIITSYRYERSQKFLVMQSLYALGATAAMIGFLFLIIVIFRWLLNFLDKMLKPRLERIQLKSFQVINFKEISTALQAVLKFIKVIVILILIYFYLSIVLGLFPWSRPLAQSLLNIFLEPLSRVGVTFINTLPDLVFIAVLVLLTRYVLKLTRVFFAGIDLGTITFANFEREWALPTYKIVRLFIIAFTGIVIYPFIPGSGSEAFKGVSIFLGVIFSLGSSSFVSNIIAGYTMTYRRAFKVGDMIRVGDNFGEVAAIRVQATYIRSPKNEEIIIPNSQILESNVMNYSSLVQQRGLIVHTTVGIGYETSWRQVEAMLKLAAERTKGFLLDPPPFVVQKSLGDFCITYELNVYCNEPKKMLLLRSALHRNILDVFNEYGVQIMTPAYEGDPGAPKIVPKDLWFTAPAKPAADEKNKGDRPEK